MTAGESDKKQKKFYDIDAYSSLIEEQRNKPPPGMFSRIRARIWGVVDISGSALFTMFMFPLASLGALGAVLVGVLYGPIAFWGVIGGAMLGLSFYVERKVGRSLTFGSYSVLRRSLAQLAAFAIVMGIVFGLLLVSRVLG